MATAVVGISFGTQSLVIAQAKRGGVDVILNESSKRLNPALVSFATNERLLGEAAVTQVRTNMANTITQVKRIVGRKFAESGVQTELAEHANFTGVELPNGEVGVEVFYNGEEQTFSCTQITAMLLTKCKQIVAFNNPGLSSVDVVISVPPFFTEAQRQSIRDAAVIANLHCLRVLNEGTAAALSYGIFKAAKKEFAEGAETRILFLDMGYAQFTATVAAFTNGSLRVTASASDADLGGRTLDVAITKFFAEGFKAKTGLDAWKNKKARVKLLIAAEKAKIDISPHGVNNAPVSIECMMEERDFNGALTAEKLDELLWPTVSERMGTVIRAVLAQAGVTDYKDFAAIELVGGGMRPRLIKRAAAIALGMPLDEASGHGLGQSMNLDEAVARGCALQCAILSPVMQVKKFDIADVIPYPIRLSWDPDTASSSSSTAAMDAADAEEDAVDAAANSTGVIGAGGAGTTGVAAAAAGENGMVIFKPGDVSPLTRRVTFKRNAPFTVTAENVWTPEQSYMIPAGTSPALGRYTITGFPAVSPADAATTGVSKIRVDFKHDEHGLFSVARAELLREIIEAGADASAPQEPGKKKKFRRFDLKVDTAGVAGLDSATIQANLEREITMITQDAEVRATQDMRNSLEAYIYSMRSQLEEGLRAFAQDAEREAASNALNDMESWLYGDGFEADKKTYQAKLRELEAPCNKIASRKWESENRYNAIQALQNSIEDYRGVMANRTGRHAHLSDADKDVLRAACSEAESWLRGKTEEQGRLEMWQDPTLRVAEVTTARDRLEKELNKIANRPPPIVQAPPAPAPVPAPAPAPATETMDTETNASPAASAADDGKMKE